MQRKIRIGNEEIIYTLWIKNVRNVNLHITSQNEIVVSCNAYVPLEKVDAFVESKMKWILDKMKKIEKRKSMLEVRDRVSYRGKSYLLEVVNSNRNGVKIKDEKLILYYKGNIEISKILDKFFRDEALRVFTSKMNEVYEMMHMDYDFIQPTLKIREMKSRWGSCMPRKNQITLNVKLIHFHERFLEYVVIHEYAHLIQPNHSKAFYYVVEKYMPDYKKVSQSLGMNEI